MKTIKILNNFEIGASDVRVNRGKSERTNGAHLFFLGVYTEIMRANWDGYMTVTGFLSIPSPVGIVDQGKNVLNPPG
jgi:hypothetical protein